MPIPPDARCPRCGAPISKLESRAPAHFRCGECRLIFDLRKLRPTSSEAALELDRGPRHPSSSGLLLASPPLAPPNRATSRPMNVPSGITLRDGGRPVDVVEPGVSSELVVVLPWLRVAGALWLHALWMGSLMAGLMVLAAFRREHVPRAALPWLGVACLPAVYVAAASWLNESVLILTRDSLQLLHRPLPLRSSLHVRAEEIAQLFCETSLIGSNEVQDCYDLRLISTDGRQLTLLRQSKSLALVLFVEELIERHFGIADQLVEGPRVVGRSR